MEIHHLPLDQIQEYGHNAKAHPAGQVKKVAASIAEFRWDQPIVVDRDMVIIKGHGRYLAAKELGIEVVPVVIADYLTPAQVHAARLADNRSAESEWLPELLGLELKLLADLDFDLGLTGFDQKEIELFLPKVVIPGLVDPDKAPPVPVNPISKAGDIWICGEHRVICGDSTRPQVLENLMAGELADVCWVDPPYNVNVNGSAGKIINDNLKDKEFLSFLTKLFAATLGAMKPGASIYVAHADTEGTNFRNAFNNVGFKLSGVIIWRKNHFSLGRSDYQWMHEPILYGWRQGAAHRWYGGRNKVTVDMAEGSSHIQKRPDGSWVIEVGDSILVVSGDAHLEEYASSITYHEKPQRSPEHPTMKPVGLIEKQLWNSARGGDLILDTCGGAGSTLIAAHRLGMKARIGELDGKFVDVIVERYQEYSGQDAVLQISGECFNEIKDKNEF